MPKKRFCCVINCSSNSETHRLFNFPRDDKLRALWLSFLIPVNKKLSLLSPSQLYQRFVCHIHFDRHQFANTGNRLAHGYPCLFTSNEIKHGIPLSCLSKNHLTDHNYILPVLKKEIDPISVATKIYNLPTLEDSMDHLGDVSTNDDDHNYSITKPVITDAKYRLSIEVNDDNMQTIKIEEVPKVDNPPMEKPKINNMQTIKIEEVPKVDKPPMEKRKIKPKEEDTKDDPLCQLFKTKFNKMTKPVQDFILMQLKTADKSKKGLRYTKKEKIWASSLMKESPKAYMLLQKMFNLPSIKTLNRLE